MYFYTVTTKRGGKTLKICIRDGLGKLSKEINKKYYKTFTIEQDLGLCDVALVGADPLNLSPYTNIKYVVCNMTNTSHILTDAKLISLREHTPLLWDVTSTAEHTIMLMLTILKATNRRQAPGRALREMTVGIIGLGRIGLMVEGLCKTFGSPVLTHDMVYPHGNSELTKLLVESDIISLHTSFKEPIPVLGKPELELLKNGAYIVNTSRPCAIDMKALNNCREKLAGFASDFLVSYCGKNFFCTDHTGGYTIDDLKKTSDFCFNLLMGEINENAQE